MHQKFITKFNKISFLIIVALCALVPLFFLPISWGGILAVKGAILYVGVFIAFSFWLLSQFVEGSLKIPRHKAFLAIGLWVLFAALSALLSKNSSVSLWGRGFAIDSFTMFLVLGLFTFLVASFAKEQKKLVTLFLATFVGAVSTVLLQVLLYVGQKLPFVANHLAHVANQGTLVGSWVDFSYFVTLTFLLALLMYEVLTPKGFFKILSISSITLSLIVLVFLNFKTAWIITIVAALLVFVYKSSVERSVSKFFPLNQSESGENVSRSSSFPILSFITLIVSLFFFLSSGSIGSGIARWAGINFSDIRPSLAASTQVMRSALWHDPIFGAGAGRFSNAWNLYHPLGVNQTQFWNYSFNNGYSLYQTILTTNGILVALSLLAVIVLSIIHGFRLFNYQFPDRFSRFIAVASLIIFVLFGAMFILSSPGIVLVVMGFLYLGLLLGVSVLVGRTKLISINYLKDPRISFFSILALVLAIMGGFVAAYFAGNRYASLVIYNHALSSSNIDSAQQKINRAISLSQNDVYLKTEAALWVNQFKTVAAGQSPDKTVLQKYFDLAEQSAGAAVAWDKTNPDNWMTLSQVYQLIASSDSKDAYTAAKNAADQAVALNPNNPLVYFNEAQVALINKDTASAKDSLNKAIQLKSDYLDAYVLLAQIKTSEGQTGAAVDEITQYIKTAPYDAQGFFLLGQAHAVDKQYQSALTAFNSAQQLSPNDPNIALAIIDTLSLMGQKDQALSALSDFSQRFPEIQGVDKKRAQIEAGTSTVDTTATKDTKKETVNP